MGVGPIRLRPVMKMAGLGKGSALSNNPIKINRK